MTTIPDVIITHVGVGRTGTKKHVPGRLDRVMCANVKALCNTTLPYVWAFNGLDLADVCGNCKRVAASLGWEFA